MDAIYVRVSTDAQAEKGYSIGDQLRTCRAHAEKSGSQIIEYVDDGYSGEFLERPGLERLRKDLRAKLIDNVIVYDPDRLSRNLTNQLLLADEIEKGAANLIFITHDYDASPEGRLFFSIRGAISAFEKAKIRERTLRGKRSKALCGKINDDGLYGYLFNSETSMYEIDQAEAEVVRLIFDLYTTRNYGTNSLYVELKSLGIVNRKGKPFSISVINYMLTNETYTGIRWSFTSYEKTISQKKRKKTARDQSEWIQIAVPAIISRETWDKGIECRRVNKVLAKRNTKQEYLLSGVIRCPSCGYVMGGTNYHRGAKDYLYYVCKSYVNGIVCDNKKCVPSKELDECVWQNLRKAAKVKNGFEIFRDKNDKENISIRTDLEKQLAKLKKRQTAIIKWVADGTVESDSADIDLQSIKKEIDATKNVINSLTISSPSREISAKKILDAKTFEDKRREIIEGGFVIYAKKESGVTAYSIKL